MLGWRSLTLHSLVLALASHHARPVLASEHISPRIVGGQPVGHAIEWMVSIEAPTEQGKNVHYCGGTLISESWVMTAAHCLYEIDYVQDMVTMIGGYDRSKPEEFEEVRMESWFIHEGYNANLNLHDIALIKLAAPSSRTPARLNIDATNQAAGARTTMIGWGMTSWKGSLSTVLQQVDMPLVSDEECLTAMGIQDAATQLCAGYRQGGVDGCQGDSGGPLVAKISSSLNEALVIGIASWGEGCAVEGKYGIYTDVDYYIPWIKTVVKDAPLTLVSPSGNTEGTGAIAAKPTDGAKTDSQGNPIQYIDNVDEAPGQGGSNLWMILLGVGAAVGVIALAIGGGFYYAGRRRHKKMLDILRESTIDLDIDVGTALTELKRAAEGLPPADPDAAEKLSNVFDMHSIRGSVREGDDDDENGPRSPGGLRSAGSSGGPANQMAAGKTDPDGFLTV